MTMTEKKSELVNIHLYRFISTYATSESSKSSKYVLALLLEHDLRRFPFRHEKLYTLSFPVHVFLLIFASVLYSLIFLDIFLIRAIIPVSLMLRGFRAVCGVRNGEF
jgi:hypothetical protein